MKNPRNYIGKSAGDTYRDLVKSGEYPGTSWYCDSKNVTQEIERGKLKERPVMSIETRRASEKDRDDSATALMITLATR